MSRPATLFLLFVGALIGAAVRLGLPDWITRMGWAPKNPLELLVLGAAGCAAAAWFRPMGFRTRFEIQAEREELLRRLGELQA